MYFFPKTMIFLIVYSISYVFLFLLQILSKFNLHILYPIYISHMYDLEIVGERRTNYLIPYISRSICTELSQNFAFSNILL